MMKAPLKDEGPARVSVPPAEMVSASEDMSFVTGAAPAMVTTGLPAGPRSMMTVSPAKGMALPLQLLARFHTPLVSVFHTLTPEYTVPRCSTALLVSPPVT